MSIRWFRNNADVLRPFEIKRHPLKMHVMLPVKVFDGFNKLIAPEFLF